MENRGFNIKDNVLRGSRTLFWLKVNFVFVLLLTFLVVLFSWTFGFIDFMNPEKFFAVDMLSLSMMLLFISGVFLFTFSFFIVFIYWIAWFYRASANVRTFAKTSFSPFIAVLCSLIPFFGIVFHYLILKELVRETELFLMDRRISLTFVKQKSIKAWFVLALLGSVSYFTHRFYVTEFLTTSLWLCSLAFYISFFSGFARYEKALFDFSQDEIIKAKVEAVLRTRDIEKQRNQEGDESPIL